MRSLARIEPSLTITVIVRGRDDEIIRCLNAIHDQTVRALDLVLILDGTGRLREDVANQWIEQNGQRFCHSELIRCGGEPSLSRARKLACEVARTDAVMIIEAGNFIYPRCGQVLLAALAESGADAAYGMGACRLGPVELIGWRPWSWRTEQTLDEIQGAILMHRAGPRLDTADARWVLVPEILYEHLGRPAHEPGMVRVLAQRARRAGMILKNEGFASVIGRVATRWNRARAKRNSVVSSDTSVGSRAFTPPRPHVQCANRLRSDRESTNERTPLAIMRFAVMSSSRGNYFFQEIRDLIAAGLRELGHEVVIGDERNGFIGDVDRHLIVAPHEFFFLGEGETLRQSEWPNGVIVVSTEQPSTTWFALAWECLSRADAVWDINASTATELTRQRLPSEYLALGYAPSYRGFSEIETLPENEGTRFLNQAIRGTEGAAGLLAERPIDLLFIGSHTPRRATFLASTAPELSSFRAYLHLHDPSLPARKGKTTFMDTETAIGLSQRSKVLLNIHHGTDVYFEWHRIVLHGLWQRTLVVSEPCSEAPPFRAGVHYVEATLDEMPRVLHYYLNDPRGQREAQAIADAGHRMLTDECRLSTLLEKLLGSKRSAKTHHFSNGVQDAFV